jgi:integrase
MRGLYKQPRSSVWWCCYKSLSGKIVRRSTGKTEYDAAVTFLMNERAEVKAGNEPEEKKIIQRTFNELATEYLKWAARQRSFVSKERIINQLTAKFGDLPLRAFNTLLLEKYQTERLQRGVKHKLLKKKADGSRAVCDSQKEPKANKPATINRHIATLKHMFTKAVEWDMVEEATLKKVRKVKLLEENNRRLRYLSKEECHNLLNQCDSHVRPIVVMGLSTGMRKNEILGLTWDNVDMKHGFILLEHTKNGERREIPINATARAALKSVTRRLDVPYVFHDDETGKRYGDIKKGFSGACRRAGIKDFHFHDLRHTFASHLVMAGKDLTTVKDLLGHKTLTMTLRYSHLAPAHKAAAVEVMDDILNDAVIDHQKHVVTGGDHQAGKKNSTSYLLHTGRVDKS